jgi:hypothetical protein
VPGGSQALRRSEDFEVRSRQESGSVPVPNLLGAILVKVRAIGVDDIPEAQRRDVGFLLSLVDDADSLTEAMTPSERKWLRKHGYFADSSHESYGTLAEAEDGAIVYRRLANID